MNKEEFIIKLDILNPNLQFWETNVITEKQILKNHKLIYNLLFEKDSIFIINKYWKWNLSDYSNSLIKECKNYEELYDWIRENIK